MRPVRRWRHVIKGPVFPSFRNQNTDPKDILVWKPGTQSMRQRIRHLTQDCRAILDSKDPEIIRVGQAVFEACQAGKVPRLAALILINAGREAADSTGLPWTQCTILLVEKFLEARIDRLNQSPTQSTS